MLLRVGVVLAICAAAGPVAADDHAVAVAGSYACARTHEGRAACWGQTPGGDQPSAALVPDLADIAGLAATRGRLVAWTRAGAAWQWSGGAPTKLAATDVVELAADGDATCARDRGGAVSCWLGDAAPVADLAGARAIAVAGHQACALAAAGASCWTIGAAAPAPAAIARARGATAIAGRDRGSRGSVFAAIVRGRVVAWAQPGGAAVAVARTTAATAVAVGDLDICAIGAAVTCGDDARVPVARTYAALAGATAIAVDQLGCAALPDGSVRCWGSPGVVGDGSPARVTTPVDVPGLTDVVELAAASETTCARRANGHVACWGERLTDPWSARTRGVDLAPVEQVGLTDARSIHVTVRDACARRANGRVACWGIVGETMRPRATDEPRFAAATWLGAIGAEVCALRGGAIVCPLPLARDFHRVPAGTTEVFYGGWFRGEYLCARAAGAITCEERWSAHGESELAVTTRVSAPDDAVAIQMPINQETDAECVAGADGVVACKAMTDGPFVTIDAAAGARAFAEGPPVSAGASASTCAVTKAHTVACWDLRTDAGAPNVVEIPGLTDAVEVAGGTLHACARRTNGTVACWGWADYLGTGGRATRDVPVVVTGVAL